MTPSPPFPNLILQALELLNRGESNAATQLLVDGLMQTSSAQGAADALAIIAICHYRLQQAHQGETAGLLAYRLRATLIDQKMLFKVLVNLTLFVIEQKSFEEAFTYGTMAERIERNDADLLANMVAACAMTGRNDQALERFEKLKESSPVRAGEVAAFFRPGSPYMAPTGGSDCTALLPEFHEIVALTRRCRSEPSMTPALAAQARGISDRLKAAIRNLERCPDGRGAYECWRTLCEYYREQLAGVRNQYLKMQSRAAIAAASGKAINAAQRHGIRIDAELWGWNGGSLGDLCFYEPAVAALRNAVALAPDVLDYRQMLERFQSLLGLDENEVQRPDSPAVLGPVRPDFDTANRQSYRFAVRDRRVERKCHICGCTITANDNAYITFASMEGDPKNLFSCSKQDCLDKMGDEIEADKIGFRIPLPTQVIDSITRNKRGIGRAALAGAILMTALAIPFTILLFMAANLLFGLGSLGAIVLVWLLGIPFFRDAFLPL